MEAKKATEKEYQELVYNPHLSDCELGYRAEGEPTDAQIELQDEIDNAIYDFLKKMRDIYEMRVSKDIPELEWDIGKITVIREEVEGLLELPEIY